MMYNNILKYESKTFVINDIPPTANTIWRTNYVSRRSYLSKEALHFFQEVAFVVNNSHAPREWPYYHVDIMIELKRRRGDVDNRIKPVLDAFTKAGYWTDDDRVASVSCRFGKINQQGRTVVTISPVLTKYGDSE